MKIIYHIKIYSPEDILIGPELFGDFRPDLIKKVLESLIPKNMNISIVGKKFEGMTDSEEKWFGVKYKITDIDHNLIDKWMNCGLNDRLSLPQKNEFIPRDLSLKPRVESMPVFPSMIKNTAMTRIWYLQDIKYNRPLASYTFKLNMYKCRISKLSCLLYEISDPACYLIQLM